MGDEKIEVRCPFMDMAREWFPLVPIVVPILFPIVPLICVTVSVMRIAAGVRRIQQQLDEMINVIRRLG